MAGEVATVDSAQALSALILCGLMGGLGQGVRAVIGLKNANALTVAPDAQNTFSAAYLLMSLMIGVIAGILAGIGIGLSNFTTIDLNNIKVLLGVAASGYAGSDFVENSLSLIIPSSSPTKISVTPAVQVPTTQLQSTLLLQSVQPLAPATDKVALTAAFRVAAPQVNTDIWVPAFVASLSKYDLNTKKRIAAAIGQFLVEAGAAFQELRENLRYTHADHIADVFKSHFANAQEAEPYVNNPEALGNRVYANREGNGDEASGDGFRFRGGGLAQLTSRNEYAEFGAVIGKSAEDAAAYCATPEGATASGCWYLSAKGCLPLADVWDISGITRKVNGSAMLGNTQRIEYANAFLKALGG